MQETQLRKTLGKRPNANHREEMKKWEPAHKEMLLEAETETETETVGLGLDVATE